MPSQKILKTDLDPSFRVNVYNSIDQNKSKKELIGVADIDFNLLISGKEFMFEIGNLDKTYVIIDRI